MQDRLLQLTDEAPSNAFFTIAAEKLDQGLCEQIREFVRENLDTVLVAIDTFQIVRSGGQDISYDSDYEEVRELKTLADELQISILLVHHLRKQEASDPLNKLSSTTGISGAMDAVSILDRGQCSEGVATMVCTGRDIEMRRLDLRFSKSDCTWELVQDSLENRALEMPELIEFMRSARTFSGSNTQLADAVSKLLGKEIAPKSLKQMMKRWRYALEEKGVFFRSHRSNGQRLVTVSFSSAPPDSDVSAASSSGAGFTVPCDPDKTGTPIFSRKNVHPA